MAQKVKIYCGVDPGATGALALIFPDGHIEIWDYSKPGCYENLVGLKSLGYDIRVVIERQNPRPGNAAKTTFSMGRNYQAWIERFLILGLPFDEVTPQTWQKEVFDAGTRPKRVKLSNLVTGVATEKKKKEFKKMREKRSREHKKKLKLASMERAKRLYPAATSLITRHDRAEALLVAHYCMLRYR